MYERPVSPLWHYLKLSGCHWKLNGKSRDIYGDVDFDTQAGKQLRLPADICFHGKVRITQTNRLSPNIIFAGDFHILPVALGTIQEGRLPRLRIPKSTQFLSSVFLNGWHGEWPENIQFILGHFFWTYSYIRKLPKVFSVHGEMNLSGSRIKKFPTELTVHDDAIMPGIQAKSLPEKIILNRSLMVWSSTLEVLPEGLSVPGDLSIKNSRISKFPDGLCVGGNLDITGTQISLIPETRFIGGEILRN
ncbi:hypothetical protein QTP22_22570 [Klebsiella grimontii]|uniref:hypothetical protein n=1 Tax=Klebsiella grimontii TaxID=2058152 RepID=UPI001CCDAC65|nr:hypothetical protein [Klebsiella grimontii]MDM4405850.1 hypothetical protein [Klebsiella grimontii]